MHPCSTIEVPFTSSIDQYTPIENISSELDHLSKNKIQYAPWPKFQYKPQCEFVIAHCGNCIFLKFFVSEDDILARFTQPNDMVYRDSCVEFFIAFNGEDKYYNLEFNCIGTCFLGYSSGNDDMEIADAETIRKIKSGILLYSNEGKMKWELTLAIPAAVFYHHDFPSLSSKTCRANFFKCGDDLPVPHYLSWNNIESAKPNFHLPAFFGDLVFNEA